MEIYPLRFFAPTVIEASASTRMVKAVTLHKYGESERIKVEDTPLDRRIPENCVEVEVHYCGLSFTDHYLRLGIIQNEMFPAIMGSECCGVVTGVGDGVTRFQVGQRVLCLRLQGGLFRHVVHVSEQYCFAVPHTMSLKTAISLGLNFVLAYLCLVEFGCPERTKSIFMDSIGGSVGTAVIELARTNPGVTIMGTASESKHHRLLSIGVDRVYRHEDDYVKEVLEAFPRGVDLVINCAGGTHFDRDFRMLKPSGRLTTIGSNSSVIYPITATWGVVRPTWDNKLLTTAEMIKKNCTMAGINVGRLLQVYPERIRLVLNQIFEMYADGKIKPCVHSVQPFEKAADGLAQLFERENVGKVLLSVNNRTDIWTEPIPVFGPAVTLPRYLGRPKTKDEEEEEEEKMDGEEDKMDGEEEKMDGKEEKMDGAEEKMDGAEEKMDGAEEKMDGAEEKMDGAEEKMDGEVDKVGVEGWKEMAKVKNQMGTVEEEKRIEERHEEKEKRQDEEKSDGRQEEEKEDEEEREDGQEEGIENEEQREDGEEEEKEEEEETERRDEGEEERDDGMVERDEGEEEQQMDQEQHMEKAKKKMEDAKKKMERAKKKMEEAKKMMEESKKKMEEYKKKMEESKKKMEESKKKMEESKKKMEESKKKMEESKKKRDESKKKVEETKKKVEKKKMEESKKQTEWPNKQMVDAHRTMNEANRMMVEAHKMMVDANMMMAEANMAMIEAKQQMAEAIEQMVEAMQQMDDAKTQMDEVTEEMEKAKHQIDKGGSSQ